jgi:hypothetical protein
MPFSSLDAARDAILGHLKTGWDAAYAPALAPYVAYPNNRDFTPKDQSVWIRPIWRTKRRFQATIQAVGARRFRQEGTLVIEVRTKEGAGVQDSDLAVDKILTIFEGQTTGPDAVIFRDVTPVEIGPDPEGHAWYLVRVMVNFEFDQFR